MVRRTSSAGADEPPPRGRSVRGVVPLPDLRGPRGGRSLRRPVARKRVQPTSADLRDAHHAVRIPRRLRAHRRARRSDQRRHVSHPRMTREQCRAAIVGPAEVCGVEIREELTNRLLNDLATFAPWDSGGTGDQLTRLVRRADQLPLLQYCLNRMWIEARHRAHGACITLELADYERIGGLGGALDSHAGEILATFPAKRRPVVEAVFRALTEGSTIADAVRRPTRFGELVAICGGDEVAVRAVVDAFRAPGCNFLAPELDADNPQPVEDDTFIDITH